MAQTSQFFQVGEGENWVEVPHVAIRTAQNYLVDLWVPSDLNQLISSIRFTIEERYGLREINDELFGPEIQEDYWIRESFYLRTPEIEKVLIFPNMFGHDGEPKWEDRMDVPFVNIEMQGGYIFACDCAHSDPHVLLPLGKRYRYVNRGTTLEIYDADIEINVGGVFQKFSTYVDDLTNMDPESAFDYWTSGFVAQSGEEEELPLGGNKQEEDEEGWQEKEDRYQNSLLNWTSRRMRLMEQWRLQAESESESSETSEGETSSDEEPEAKKPKIEYPKRPVEFIAQSGKVKSWILEKAFTGFETYCTMYDDADSINKKACYEQAIGRNIGTLEGSWLEGANLIHQMLETFQQAFCVNLDNKLVKKLIDNFYIALITLQNASIEGLKKMDRLRIIWQTLVASGVVRLTTILKVSLEVFVKLVDLLMMIPTWMLKKVNDKDKNLAFMDALGGKEGEKWETQGGEWRTECDEEDVEGVISGGFLYMAETFANLLAQGGEMKNHPRHTELPFGIHYWSKLLGSITSIGKSFEYLGKIAWYAISTAYQWVYGEPLVHDEVKEYIKQVKEWQDQVRDVMDIKNKDIKAVGNDIQFCQRLVFLESQGDLLSGKLTEMGYTKTNFAAFFNMFKELKEICVAARGVIHNAHPRAGSVLLYMYGGSNVGKSTCIQNILCEAFRYCMQEQGLKVTPGSNVIYPRKSDNEFWSGYMSNFATLYDDFAQVEDVDKLTKEVEEIFYCCNTSPFPLNMNLNNDKGNYFYDSDVLGITTNVPILRKPHHMKIAMPDAWYRRIDIQVELVVKPEFVKTDPITGLKGIDKSKGFQKNAVEFYRMDPRTGHRVHDKTTNKDLAPISFDDMVALLCVEIMKRKEQQKNIANVLHAPQVDLADIKKKVDLMMAQGSEDLPEEQKYAMRGKRFNVREPLRLLATSPDGKSAQRHLESGIEVTINQHCKTDFVVKVENGKFKDYTAYIPMWMLDQFCAESGKEGKEIPPRSGEGSGMELPEAPEPASASSPTEKDEVRRRFGEALDQATRIIKEQHEAGTKQIAEMAQKFEERKDSNLWLKILLTSISAIGVIASAFALYKIFTKDNMRGQGEAPSRGMDQKRKKQFADQVNAKKGGLQRKFLTQASPSQDVVEHVVKPNLCRIITENRGSRHHVNGLFVKDRIVRTVQHLDLYLEGNDYDRIILEAWRNGKLEEMVFKVDELVFMSKQGTDVQYIEFPKKVSARSNILKHFAKAKDVVNGDLSNVTLCTLERGGTMKEQSAGDARKLVRDTTYLFEHKGDKVNIPISDAVVYSIGTAGGQCGAPLVVNNSRFEGKILSLHVAGDGHRGMGAIITYEETCSDVEEVESMEGKPWTAQSWKEYLRTEGVEPRMEYPEKLEFVGKIPPNMAHRLPNQTQIVPSPLKDMFFPAKTEPAMLKPTNGVKPLENAMKKIGEKIVREVPDKDLVEDIAELEFSKIPYKVPARILQFSEAINGVDNWEYTKSIFMGTSGGFQEIPELGKGKGKSKYFDKYKKGDGWRYEMKDAFQKSVIQAEGAYGNGETGIMLSELNLKDERRTHEKVAAGKTRPFVSAQLKHLILGRRAFGAFMENLALARESTGIAKGTNPHSREWRSMYLRHRRFGDKQKELEGDASNFDWRSAGLIQDQFCIGVNAYYRRWYEMHQKELGMDDEDLELFLEYWENVRKGLVADATKNIHILVIDDVVKAIEGMISGYFGTFDHNSVNSKIIHQYCILKRAREIRKHLLKGEREKALALFSTGNDPSEFDYFIKITNNFDFKVSDLPRLCELDVGGDDFWLSLAEELTWYNFSMLLEETTKLGWIYTPSDKSGEIYKHKEMENVRFLKRAYRGEDGEIFAPMEEEDIVEITYWISKDMDVEEATRLNVETALREMGHHGRKKFNLWKERFNRALIEIGYRPVILSFNDWLADFMGDELEKEDDLSCVWKAQSGSEDSIEDLKLKCIAKMEKMINYTKVYAAHPKNNELAPLFVMVLNSCCTVFNLVEEGDPQSYAALEALLVHLSIVDEVVPWKAQGGMEDEWIKVVGFKPDWRVVRNKGEVIVSSTINGLGILGRGPNKEQAFKSALDLYVDIQSLERSGTEQAQDALISDALQERMRSTKYLPTDKERELEILKKEISMWYEKMADLVENLGHTVEEIQLQMAKAGIFGTYRAQSGKEAVAEEVVEGHTVQQGLTVIQDIHSTETESMPETRPVFTRHVNPYQHETLENVLCREYRVAQITWDGAGGQGNLISALHFPYALLTVAPNLVEKKNRFHLWKADVEVRFEITGSAYHYGKLLGGWTPHHYDNSGPVTSWKTANIWSLSTSNPFTLSPNSMKNEKIVIPYVSPRYYMTDEQTLPHGYIGSVILRILHPLIQVGQTGVPAVTVSVFANFKNVELAAPSLSAQSGEENPPPSSGLSAQSGREVKEAKKKTQEGVVTGALKRAGTAALSLEAFGLGGKGALAAAALRAMAGISQALGYSKPNSVAAVQPMYLSTINSMSNGNGLNTLNDLSLEPGGMIPNGPNFFGRTQDELDISNLIRKPGLFDTWTILSTDVAGRVIKKYDVRPVTCPTYQDGGGTEYSMYHTPLSMIATQFEYWKGPIRYRFELSCSSFTSGRIRVSWHPLRSEIPTDFTTGEGDFISKVINFQGDTSFNFSVPYLNRNAALRTGGSLTLEPERANGTIAVSVVNSLINAETIGTSIVYVSCWIAAGDGFQFYKPADFQVYGADWTNNTYDSYLSVDPLVSTSGTWIAQSGLINSIDLIFETEAFEPLNPAMVSVDRGLIAQENVLSLRTLLHRNEKLKTHPVGSLIETVKGIYRFDEVNPKWTLSPYTWRTYNDGSGNLRTTNGFSVFDMVMWWHLYSRGGYNLTATIMNTRDNNRTDGVMFCGQRTVNPINGEQLHSFAPDDVNSYGKIGFTMEDFEYKKSIQVSVPYYGTRPFVTHFTEAPNWVVVGTPQEQYEGHENEVEFVWYTRSDPDAETNFSLLMMMFYSMKDDFEAAWAQGVPIHNVSIAAAPQAKKKGGNLPAFVKKA